RLSKRNISSDISKAVRVTHLPAVISGSFHPESSEGGPETRAGVKCSGLRLGKPVEFRASNTRSFPAEASWLVPSETKLQSGGMAMALRPKSGCEHPADKKKQLSFAFKAPDWQMLKHDPQNPLS